MKTVKLAAAIFLMSFIVGVPQGFAHGKKGHEEHEMPQVELKPVKLILPKMDAMEGKRLFIKKLCITCHTINGVGGDGTLTLDVSAMATEMNMFEFGARMWNHATGMISSQVSAFGDQIRLNGQELAHITAFTHDHRAQHTMTIDDIPPEVRKLMNH